ncbi:2-keto-4-pentenoate hydratase [Geosporobacter ferrireducens]|uniref:2-keto-4-pentenoate hydratase n=1 Tax=Geosporobacter ferrireducens TaxID=1424294 RepID=A0A1D8GK45_9FIRM|nr:fumarylacetoacetate hydrolase family protein [Geosporobacter ferrireducens]AOT71275.1 2-keto-4-pentenoate hydratase [Geosporobacter ferrireducens]MTI58088.1 2-keto-4-pentenoate hydratase [Geosporobacter ferrireducens]
MDCKKVAADLYKAEKEAYQIETISTANPDMTIADAYAIQLENVAKRVAEGEKIIGVKVGLTSKAMQKLLGVDEPDYGHLTDKMLLLEGDKCPMKELIQPKVEGELAFCLKKTLKGPGVTIADVYNATGWVVPAIEIVDSRIKDWKIKLVDTIADNGSSAKLVLGSTMTPIGNVDMRLVGMNLEKNGEIVSTGTGAAVWGNPAAAVAWLANKLSQFDIELKEGDIILSGAVTAAEAAKAGDIFTVSFQGMGSVTVKFE